MRLISFKTFKVPVMVICMLAAGICYSCSKQQDISGKEEIVLALEKQEQPGNEAPESRAPEDTGTPEKKASDAGKSEEMTADAAAQAESKAPGDAAAAPKVFAHVCGKVNQPGVYALPEGSRVCDAIEAAGGFQEDGAREYLNLAELVGDGMKLEVPSEDQVKEWKEQGLMPVSGHGAGAGSGAAAGIAARINLNTASKEELMNLRGIGESRAEDIIRYRETFGGFKSIEDIMNVSGIKSAAFEKIKDSITV